MPAIILIVISVISMVFFTVATLICRRVYLQYLVVIKRFRAFLMQFEETPRSKFAKKYLPPLEMLVEESSVQETIYSVKNSFNRFSKVPPSILMTRSRASSESIIIENIMEEDVRASAEFVRKTIDKYDTQSPLQTDSSTTSKKKRW